MRKYRKLSLLITGVLAFGTLTGCGGNGNTASTGGDAKSNKSITVLTHRTDMEDVF